MSNAQPTRCSWVNVDHVLMREYHDREWGVPAHDDRTHFEFLILEAAQAGLSWSIVLNKRDGYRRAFSDFNPEKVARYSERTSVSGGAGRTRQLRRVLLAIRRRPPATESMENHAPDSHHDAGVRRIQSRSEAARIQLRGVHHDLGPHAGSRDGQRSSHRLFSISGRSAARCPQRSNPNRGR